MRTAHLTVCLGLAACLSPLDAIAQSAADSVAAGRYKWDVAATGGLVIIGNQSESPYGVDHDGATAWNVDAGRYLSTHLKIETSVMGSSEYYNSEPRSFPVAGLPPEYSYLSWALSKRRSTSVSAAATYQFFENQFAHPYVSAGVAAVLEHEHNFRPQHIAFVSRTPYDIPALDETTTRVFARPFVAAGWKSYFNERVFIRSEALFAVRPEGLSHATLRVGAGFDF